MKNLHVIVYGDYDAFKIHRQIVNIEKEMNLSENKLYIEGMRKDLLDLWTNLFELDAKIDIRYDINLLSSFVILPTFEHLTKEVITVAEWQEVIELLWKIKGSSIDAFFDYFHMEIEKHYVTAYKTETFLEYGIEPRTPKYMRMEK